MQPQFDLPVSRNKVRVPVRRRELITRARLVDALYEQIEKRILLIVAPAGYGKTSLLVDLAQQTELPVCWLSLDSLDQEPQRFLRYLIASISERFPEFGRDSLAALESMSSIEKDLERLLVTITNEINIQTTEHFFLILDDYHLVGSIPSIGHMISRFLLLTGENIHLVLASRNLPDLPDSPLLVARNQVGGLSFEELSFLPEEIQELFQQNNGLALSRQDADTLVQQTEGWIAAIHLTNGQPGSLPRMHPLESTRELFDFFSTEILLRQTEQVRRFLLMTSFFDTFDVALCEKVLEPLMEGEVFDWALLFEIVRSKNLFSVPLDAEGRWMRYHHLFRHFLKSQLQFEQPVLAWHIQHNLAHTYEEEQSWEEALQVYARMDDYENQVRLLKLSGTTFISSGRILSLAYWLEKLPDEVLFSQPVLVSLLGGIYTSKGDNRRALDTLNFAEERLRDGGNETDWVRTLARRAEVNRQLELFDQAMQDVDRILEMKNDFGLLSIQSAFAEAQRIKGLVLVGLGDMKNALVWLEKSLHTCRTLGLRKNIPILETELGVVHRRMGELDVATRYYTSALKALENAGNTGWKARLLNNMGLLYHMTGRLADARSSLEDAVNIAERSGYTRIQTNILISLGDLHSDLSSHDTAYDYYDRALTLATNLGHSLYIFYASIGCARLQRLNGEPLLAIEDLRQAEVSQVSMGPYERALFNLELGCCWLEINKMEAAIVALRDAVALFGEGGDRMEQVIARLWLETALSVQFPDTAIMYLKELMPSQREWQKPTSFMIHVGRACRWLRKRGSTQLFKDPVLGKFFEQAELIVKSLPGMIKAMNQKAEVVPLATPQLVITSFGDVQVRRDQHIVGTSEWQTREARDLFFFLLQSPPSTKEQIGLQFWPDISPSRLKMRFKINIYRIRQAVGQDVVIYENERYRFNSMIDYSWDREKLDKLLQALQNVKDDKKGMLIQQAVELLQGSYLADLDAEWAVPDRLRYKDMYRELLVELAGIYLQVGQVRECLRIARLALSSDPLLEGAHRLIIQAYATLHDPAGMTFQYRQYQQVMMTELGLQPSLEISALYEQLLDKI